MTANVLAYNGMVDGEADRATMSSPVIPTGRARTSKEIRYVVFITKENHTYDTIFDHVPGSQATIRACCAGDCTRRSTATASPRSRMSR